MHPKFQRYFEFKKFFKTGKLKYKKKVLISDAFHVLKCSKSKFILLMLSGNLKRLISN
jgi:hypothetical protein